MSHFSQRTLKHLRGATDDGIVLVAGNWAIGATGAVGAKVGGTGLALTRSGVGTYSLQLQANGAAAKANAILYASVGVVEADADPTDDTDAYRARILTHTPSTGIITFQTYDEAGVARDPASGAFVMVFVVAKVSSVP